MLTRYTTRGAREVAESSYTYWGKVRRSWQRGSAQDKQVRQTCRILMVADRRSTARPPF